MTPERGLVLVIGSASRDIAPGDPRGWRLGGAVMYAGLALARLGVATRVLAGVDAAAAEAHELDALRAAGVELRLVQLGRCPVFENRETPFGRVQTCLEPGEPIPPAALPADWAGSPAWVFGPVAAELEEAWATVPRPEAFVALGWQGLLRDLSTGGVVARRRPWASAIVARADLIVVGRDDLDPGTGPADLLPLLHAGAELLLTDGRRGGIAVGPDAAGRRRRRTWLAITADREIDPTGAGDALLAGVVAARLGDPLGTVAASPVRRTGDLRLGAAVASLTVEAPGLAGVPSRVAVEARIRRRRAARPPG